MKRWLFVVAVSAACGGSSNHKASDAAIDSPAIADAKVDAPVDAPVVLVDAPADASGVTCNPLTQTGCAGGEKCTWLIDAVTPQYVGHIGCVPAGVAAVDGACIYGQPGVTGYDNCAGGLVCSAYSSPGVTGVCKTICDNQGGNPMCDANHTCETYSRLFFTGVTTPAAAGVCDPACDPLADNDFDGSAGSQVKTANVCGSNYQIGCYGIPSAGTPPATGWSCTGDIHSNPDLNLRHRTECTVATGCADPDGTIYVNSCNQGYLPLFRESTAVSTAVCIAMCKPADCYAGNCGTNDVNRIGAAPHRCSTPDALGNFGSDENCMYEWNEEIDANSTWLPSPTSNTVGFCFDHSKYMYDPTGGNNPTIPLPSCEQLQLHATSTDPNMPLTYFGAVDFGCVSTTTGGIMFSGKVSRRPVDLPRPPYRHAIR